MEDHTTTVKQNVLKLLSKHSSI